MIVRMWEVIAHPEAHHDLLAWVCDVGVPEIEADLGHIRSEVFTAPDHRVMVVSRWRTEPRLFADPPGYYVKVPANFVDFSLVDR